MRSKEVEEGIKRIQRDIKFDKDHRIVTIFDEKPLDRDYYEAVLNYISELEKENMTLLTRLRADSLIDRDNYWRDKIKDTIKEIEKLNFNNYANEYDNGNEVKYYILKNFKEIIGE